MSLAKASGPRARKTPSTTLNLYADSRDETIFLKYQQAIAVPQGGHDLRVALDRQPPDLRAAREGILKGGNHPDDVSSLIWLYLNFRHFSYLETAIDRWTVGDAYLVELDNVAREMHQRISEESRHRPTFSAGKNRSLPSTTA
jgi:hypothetical protein